MKFYIAGPMRGHPQFNFPAFDAAAALLRSQGHEAFNPADRDRAEHGDDFADANTTGDEAQAAESHGFNLRDALGDDTRWICQHADGIYLLDGWEHSKGATAEKALADALGLAVVYQAPPGAEVRTTSSTGGQKGVKPERFDLIPVGPLTDLARLYGAGAAKYEPRNYERGYEWSKSFGAMQRHAWLWWGGEDTDAETGVPHVINVAWHAFALALFMVTHPEFDDRPGRTPAVSGE